MGRCRIKQQFLFHKIMKVNKILAIAFVSLAVMLYTMAVVDFTIGKTGNGISNLLMAVSDTLFAYVMLRIERQREALARITGVLIKTFKALEDGVPATLTITKKDDDEEEEIPEDELTDDEKRIKRMAEEYDKLTGRLERLQAFRDTDTYEQLPENSRFLLDKQCKAMDDYQTYLKRRIELDCSETDKNDSTSA